jgi:hypothetical protein
MPSSSKKQHNFMEAIAHSPSFAKKVGIPQSVGQDFSAADKGRKFAKGGDMATKGMNLFKGKETYKEELAEGKAIKSGKITPQQYAKGEESEKKMAMGGSTSDDPRDMDPRMAAVLAAKMGRAPSVKAPSVRAPGVRPPTDPRIASMMSRAGTPGSPMKKGGMAKFAAGGFTKEADGIAQRGKTQAAQPKMFASGGFVRSADGCAQRGKTKAKQVKMAGGGSC